MKTVSGRHAAAHGCAGGLSRPTAVCRLSAPRGHIAAAAGAHSKRWSGVSRTVISSLTDERSGRSAPPRRERDPQVLWSGDIRSATSKLSASSITRSTGENIGPRASRQSGHIRPHRRRDRQMRSSSPDAGRQGAPSPLATRNAHASGVKRRYRDLRHLAQIWARSENYAIADSGSSSAKCTICKWRRSTHSGGCSERSSQSNSSGHCVMAPPWRAANMSRSAAFTGAWRHGAAAWWRTRPSREN